MAVAKKSLPSKRSEKKVVRKRLENAQRREELIASIEKRKAQEGTRAARTTFSSEDLSAALELVASAPDTKKRKQSNQVSGKTNRGKQLILASETAQLKAVLADPSFQVNPVGAICQHLSNSFPDIPSSSSKSKQQGREEQRQIEESSLSATTRRKKKKKR